jgi:hypothetical protein
MARMKHFTAEDAENAEKAFLLEGTWTGSGTERQLRDSSFTHLFLSASSASSAVNGLPVSKDFRKS